MMKLLHTDNEHSKHLRQTSARIGRGIIIALCVMLAAQLFAAQRHHARPAHARRASSAYRPISGRPERRPPLLIVALSEEQLHLSETQKNRLRHALPLPPKSPRQETTPSLIASFPSLQAAEWTLICDVLTPQQLDILLHRLASMRIFRMLQMKLQALLFSSTISISPDVRRMSDTPAAISMMSAIVIFAFYAYLPQNFHSISGKTRLQHLRVLRL